MKVRITDELTQQIVDSARAVVGWNINFIDRHGRIMAVRIADVSERTIRPAMLLPGPVRSRLFRKTGLRTASAEGSIILSSWIIRSWASSGLPGIRLSSVSTVSC